MDGRWCGDSCETRARGCLKLLSLDTEEKMNEERR